jgi:methyl-accepting chemotaxis protein
MGVTYVRQVLDLLPLAQSRRRAATAHAPDLAALQDKVSKAFEQVRAQHAELGNNLGAGKAFKTLEAAHDALLKNPTAATTDDTFEAHTQFIGAALDLVRVVAYGSKLVLDPDADTFHMMEMSVLHGPAQQENTARLRGMGYLMLKTGGLTVARHERMLEWRSLAGYIDSQVENAYQAGIEIEPEVAKLFDMKGTDMASEAFMAAVDSQVTGAELSGEASSFLELGNNAVDKQTALTRLVLERLDTQLQARISRIQTTLGWQLGTAAFFLMLAGYLVLSF